MISVDTHNSFRILLEGTVIKISFHSKDTLKDLEKGTVLRKLRRHGNQIHDYKRTFKLDLTQECITWHEVGSKSKKGNYDNAVTHNAQSGTGLALLGR